MISLRVCHSESHFGCFEEFLYRTLDIHGDYFRLLLDGSYAIQAVHDGYEPKMHYVHVHNKQHQHDAQRLDFTLQPTTMRSSSRPRFN